MPVDRAGHVVVPVDHITVAAGNERLREFVESSVAGGDEHGEAAVLPRGKDVALSRPRPAGMRGRHKP